MEKETKEQEIRIQLRVGRIVAGAYYDMQGVRIATKNRIRDIVRKKVEGIPFDVVEDKKTKKDFIKKYTDKQLLFKWEELLAENKITKEEYEYVMECWELVNESERLENKYKKVMMKFVEMEPVYKAFLGVPLHFPDGRVQSGVKGIGIILAANLIKEFGDCRGYGTVSSLWAHTGNDVRAGVAPKRRKGEKTKYDPKLRTLTWKISDCLMKQNKGHYRELYETTKADYLSRRYEKGYLKAKYGNPYGEDDTKLLKGHAHNIALRKMRKRFLSHYWACAREMAGLDTRPSYVEEKLGHKNIITWRDALRMEGMLEKRSEKVKP